MNFQYNEVDVSGCVHDQQGARSDAANYLGNGLRLLAQWQCGGVWRLGQQAHCVPPHPRGGLAGTEECPIM